MKQVEMIEQNISTKHLSQIHEVVEHAPQNWVLNVQSNWPASSVKAMKDTEGIALEEPEGGIASIFQSISSVYFFLSLYTALALLYLG